ncbi:MAG: L-threonylcarbamoyladenylate synthase [Candidatus Glassbacteria bacterium]
MVLMAISRRIRIPSDREDVQSDMMRMISRVLLDGGVMAYPTETVYGLGCLAFDERPFERICKLKGRTSHRPFIVLIPSVEWIDRLALVGPDAVALSMRFWPGPLTLVLEAKSGICERLLGEGRTIALRYSSSSFVSNLMRELKQPLISTSANPEGDSPPLSPEEVIRYFDGREEVIDLLVEWPERMTGTASTVLSLAGCGISILREGPITEEEIRRALR